MVMPSTPVKVNPMKLKPAAFPRLSCRVPPIRNMIKKGKMNAPIRRWRSRMNLRMSREAMAAMAFKSLTGLLRQDPQVGILEGRLPCAQPRDRDFQRTHHLIHRAAGEADCERPVFLEIKLHLAQLFAKLGAVGRIQLEVVL